MIIEIIIIWAASIYFSMYLAGQKGLSIRKAFLYSLFLSILALIFYLMWVPKSHCARYRYDWGGLGCLLLICLGILVIYWTAYFYIHHPTII